MHAHDANIKHLGHMAIACTSYAQDIREATQLDATGSSMSTAGISWASPLVSPTHLPATPRGVVQVSRGFHVGAGAVANAGSQTAWSCGPLHFGEALMLAAGLHGQIWTIVPDKSRSKFLQAVPKPPHTGSDGALPLLYTGGLWTCKYCVKSSFSSLLQTVKTGDQFLQAELAVETCIPYSLESKHNFLALLRLVEILKCRATYSWHHKSAYTHLHFCGLEHCCASPNDK